MINPQQIHHVHFSNKQIKLDLGFSQVVPVSKKYQDTFNSTLHADHPPHI
ncbi:hypothetical protein [Limibacter armeniacum]